jgi:hypothetical protein
MIWEKETQGRSILEDQEPIDFAPFLLLNRFIRPLVVSMLPDQASELFKNLTEMVSSAPDREQEINTLKTRVQEMEKKFSQQEKKITQLNALLKKRQ